MRSSVIGTTLGVVLVTAGVATWAGPLDPPAGPVASTYKTLSDVEPRVMINAVNTPGTATSVYRITKPGSYYLGAGFTGESGKDGILIQSSNVSVDLCGFEVVGVGGSLKGVSLSGTGNISVRNGHLEGPWNIGVDLQSGASANTRIEDVVVNGAVQIGLRCGTGGIISHCSVANLIGPTSGSGFGIIGFSGPSLVIDCTVSNCKGYGIAMGSGGAVSRCSAFGCTTVGIAAISDCVVSDCSSQGNGFYGFSCIENGSSGTGVQFVNCAASDNTVGGFQLSSRGSIRDCLATQNALVGIICAGAWNRIDSNHVSGGSLGIQVTGQGNIIVRNSAANVSGSAYSIVAGNDAGPLGVAASVTSPWANLKD